MRTFQEQVAKGIALLDEKRPGWRKRVKLDDLFLGNCMWCVLGQEFARDSNGVPGYGEAYWAGLRTLFPYPTDDETDLAVAHGFTLIGEVCAWGELTDEWVLQLTS